jgi:CheY-like chemotaxis protein
MRQIMEKTFAAEPASVVTVPSGEAAIAKAREIRPAVVVADAGMPGVNGYELCRALRQDPTLGKVPVLILGGVSAPYDEARGREVGATDSMKKPFDTTKLIEKVNELAASAPAFPAAVATPAAVPAVAAPMAPRTPPAHAPAAPAFGRPPSPPPAPARPAPGAGPVASTPASRPIKETMEFAKPFSRPPAPEVKPIEIDEDDDDHGSIQVGTLAELAQMDERGSHLEPVTHEQAIELTPMQPAPAPAAPAPAATIQKAVAAVSPRSAEIAAKVGGELTAEQVEAIRRLTVEVVERVVWEVVPDLAEAIIQERLARLLEE